MTENTINHFGALLVILGILVTRIVQHVAHLRDSPTLWWWASVIAASVVGIVAAPHYYAAALSQPLPVALIWSYTVAASLGAGLFIATLLFEDQELIQPPGAPEVIV